MNFMERKCRIMENQGGFMEKEQSQTDTEQQVGHLNNWKRAGKALSMAEQHELKQRGLEI